MFKILTPAHLPLLGSALLFTPLIAAEPFNHNNAKVSYRAEHWAISGERAITDNFYVTGFYHHSDDIANASDVKAKAKIIGAGIMTLTSIDSMTQVYAGATLQQSKIKRTQADGAWMDESNFYPAISAGVTVSPSAEFEVDFNVSHYFSDAQYKYDYYDNTSVTIVGQYFINQAMAVGLSYVWLEDQSKVLGWDNLGLSFSLYFE